MCLVIYLHVLYMYLYDIKSLKIYDAQVLAIILLQLIYNLTMQKLKFLIENHPRLRSVPENYYLYCL